VNVKSTFLYSLLKYPPKDIDGLVPTSFSRKFHLFLHDENPPKIILLRVREQHTYSNYKVKIIIKGASRHTD